MEFKPEDIKHAKNLVRAVHKMKCGEDMLGLEARALGRAVDWLDDFIQVMENPPKPPSIPNPEDASFKVIQVIKNDEPNASIGDMKDGQRKTGTRRKKA